MTVVYWIYTMAIAVYHDNDFKVVVSSQHSITCYKSTNQKIRIHTVYESWVILI